MNGILTAEPLANCKATHTHFVRIYWEDTDAGGVVFYANYLKYFERARTEWLRTLGIHQHELMHPVECDGQQSMPISFVVSTATIKYIKPAKLDDWLKITLRVTHSGSASMDIAQEAWCENVMITQFQVRIACVDPISMKLRRLPEKIRHVINKNT